MNWYNIQNSINNALSISIDEEIGSFGIDAKSFIDEVKNSGAKDIELTINSGGGSVFDALAIYDHLKNGGYNVSVRIEGLAASAATIIALSGSSLPVMTENSFFMIHNAWMPVVSMAGMNSEEIREFTEELEKQAALMDKINLRLAKIYSNVTGMDLEKVQGLMSEDTWFTAEEAKEAGFISEVESSVAVAAYVSPKELSKKGYKNIPKNYVNQLNNVDMSENTEKSLMDKLKALVGGVEAPKAEEAKEVVDVEALKAEISASLSAEMEAKLEAKDAEAKELKAAHEAEINAKAEELEAAKKELDKAKASKKEVPAKEDQVDAPKKEEVKDELGEYFLAQLKARM
jgi:ATP-dependent protease ClpP protease subunit